MATVLITGAAGNLGSLLARYMCEDENNLSLILMTHRTPVPQDVRAHPKVTVRQADLSKPQTLDRCLEGVDVIVHFAGVLFKARPEEFLHETNIVYFKNLVNAAERQGVKRVILISFPHVEGPTSREHPATGRLDGKPVSVHAQTRLEEEKYLFSRIERPVSLRVGMVYGQGILMVDAARWFARWFLLGVWTEKTEIHLISKTDFARAVTAAVIKEDTCGIYHIGDEGKDTLQSFLDTACGVWGLKKPWRMPLGLIYAAADLFEMASEMFKTKSPLTRDFIDIGRVPYYGDTSRFRRELLPELIYPTLKEGVRELVQSGTG